MPFPIMPLPRVPSAPNPDPNSRTYRFSGRDTFTGPGYCNRRGNTDVIPVHGAPKDVRRFGVNPHNRGEWLR